MVTVSGSIAAWFSQLLACMGGCFGCCTKPTPIIAVDEPSKGLKIQGRAVKKHNISDGFWSTSTCDLENSALQSQRSISSISTSNLNFSQCSGASGTSMNSCDYVNHGLLLWNQCRHQWVGSNRTRIRSQPSWAPKSSWTATYESLLGSRNPFPRPIPLSEMVDFLVDVWEHEGLYD